MQAERRAYTDGNCNPIIAKKLDPASNNLTTQTAQDAITVCGQGVEELESGAQGQSAGDERDDVWVRREQLRDVVTEGGEEEDVEGADGDGDDEGDFGGSLGGGGEGGADEVGDAGAGGDGDGKGDLKSQAGEGGKHGLRGEVRRAEVGGGQREDLEGEPFRFDHDEARDGEADHGSPVLEGAFREAVPAGSAVDEADVEEEDEREEVFGHDDGDGGADETPVELLEWWCKLSLWNDYLHRTDRLPRQKANSSARSEAHRRAAHRAMRKTSLELVQTAFRFQSTRTLERPTRVS